jgi:hypothetical protein
MNYFCSDKIDRGAPNAHEYVKGWLNGVGRPDLARKADRDELPELNSEAAVVLFAEFQQKKASPNDFLSVILGIDP